MSELRSVPLDDGVRLGRYVADQKIPVLRLPSGHRRFRRSDVEALLLKEPLA